MPKEQVMLGVDGSIVDFNKVGWLFQPKFDGNRGKIVYENDKVQIINRRGEEWTERLPEITEAFLELAHTTGVRTFVIDGEIVVFKDGHTNLRLSNSRCATRDVRMIRLLYRRTMPVDFMAFDVMEWNETRLEHEPFHYRCKRLGEILQVQIPRLHLTPTYMDRDECWEEWVVRRGEEGIMMKWPYGRYLYERSYEWVKVKIRDRGVFNVCGYTEGEGKRADTFGALILTDDKGNLKGRCGGGFTDAEAQRILQVLKQAKPIPKPFSESEAGLPYTALDTNLKVEVTFLSSESWKSDNGKLRSPQLTKWWVDDQQARPKETVHDTCRKEVEPCQV